MAELLDLTDPGTTLAWGDPARVLAQTEADWWWAAEVTPTSVEAWDGEDLGMQVFVVMFDVRNLHVAGPSYVTSQEVVPRLFGTAPAGGVIGSLSGPRPDCLDRHGELEPGDILTDLCALLAWDGSTLGPEDLTLAYRQERLEAAGVEPTVTWQPATGGGRR